MVACLKREFENERMVSHFNGCTWCVIGWRKNLHPRASATPRPRYTEAREAVIAPYLHGASTDRILYLNADTNPPEYRKLDRVQWQ